MCLLIFNDYNTVYNKSIIKQGNQWITVKIRKGKKKLAAAALQYITKIEARPQGVHKKYGPRDREDGQNDH